MPLPRLQTLLLLLSLLTLLLLLCYLSFTTLAPDSTQGQTTSSFLFPASAVISLTEDNSTFFISRPAAFGPLLPKKGMEGELFVLEEGQLACDDTPGWDPSASLALGEPNLPEGVQDDGTDNILNPSVPSTEVKGSGGHADIESLQQSAQIEGKIVLVSRGGCGFLEKVLWAQRRGGIALIVGDYKRPGIGGSSGLVTMYAKGDTSNVSIPSLFTSHTTASLLTTLLPKNPASLLKSTLGVGNAQPRAPTAPSQHSTGLWITLTPTTMTSSPFFDTLLVLVVSPLVTLTVVYAVLLIRSRIRRRRWRAPKSLVERLPVRTYQAINSPPSPPSPPIPQRSSSLPNRHPTTTPTTPNNQPRRFPLFRPHRRSETPPSRRNTPTALPSQKEFARRFWSGNSECVVCLEDYVDGVSQVMRLPCGHEFHVGCITPWLTTRRRTCPICKSDVVRGVKAEEATITLGEGADETTPLVFTTAEDDDEDQMGLEAGVDLERGPVQ